MNIGMLETMIDEGNFEEVINNLVDLQDAVYALQLRTRRVMDRHPEYDEVLALELMKKANNMGMAA